MSKLDKAIVEEISKEQVKFKKALEGLNLAITMTEELSKEYPKLKKALKDLNLVITEELSKEKYKPKKSTQSDPAVSVCEQNPCLCKHIERYKKLCDDMKK